jgi:transposase
MQEKIKELEKALVNSELRATAYETMIEIAEKELKINIRKKSNTKPSIR